MPLFSDERRCFAKFFEHMFPEIPKLRSYTTSRSTDLHGKFRNGAQAALFYSVTYNQKNNIFSTKKVTPEGFEPSFPP